jgi:Lon protease-like protein
MPINRPPRDISRLPQELALFPLSGAILLPRAELPLNVFEPRYLEMVEDALRGDRMIGMIQPDAARPDCARGPGLFEVGCAGRITQFAETGDGRLLVTLTGVSRFKVAQELETATAYRRSAVDFSPYAGDLVACSSLDGRRADVMAALRRFAQARSVQIDWEGVEETPTEALVNALAMMSPFGVAEKQALVEASTLDQRAAALIAMSEFSLAESPAAKASLQ